MKEQLKEQVVMILEDFNFKEIHDVMAFLGWKWKNSNTPDSVPLIEELKSVAEMCLTKAAESSDETAICAIGPFEAEKIQNTLQLTFVLQRINPLSQLLNPQPKDELARKS